ncbi:PREDICTED: uncharacterized protein LOC104752357 isoform X2 [Camelina sativa]|nr:PREDICTED: uncharacterized protein LOC104752357 isoform X2 [Camelina sativa]
MKALKGALDAITLDMGSNKTSLLDSAGDSNENETQANRYILTDPVMGQVLTHLLKNQSAAQTHMQAPLAAMNRNHKLAY